MRLPRRVPWRSLQELDEVCSWIYSESATHETKLRAINRLAAWRVQTAVPHSLESTWMLLNAQVNDSTVSNKLFESSTALIVRQTYALAIIRLVNGLVDPLQQGIYARPISSIAAQIGLPTWLVDIRHAATHEDLPSLEVLREAANQSLDWLLHHYWIPTISPSREDEVPLPELPPLAPLLKEYKNLVKQTVKDVSLRTKLRGEILKSLRQLERWIGEIKVSYGVSLPQAEEEDKETWSIDQLCEGLLLKGALLPKSKKKRTEDIVSEPSNIFVWEQLIAHLQTRHPTFCAQLHLHIGARLLTPLEDDRPDVKHLTEWLVWLVRSYGSEVLDCSPRAVASSLLKELSTLDFSESSIQIVERVLQSISFSSSADLDHCMALIHRLRQSPYAEAMDTDAADTPMETMEERLKEVTRKLEAPVSVLASPTSVMASIVNPESNPAPGLRLLTPETGWRPCPIGVNGLALQS